MEERKFISLTKNLYGVKEFIKKEFGKGRISNVKIDHTPVGEKITIYTHKPGIIIGKKGESIEKLTTSLKKKFKTENPHIDIGEVKNLDLDAQLVADDIASALERFGSLRFKAIAYRALVKIKNAGALGGEIVLSGKLPSERAKRWRFKFGYLKKTGDMRNLVDRASSQSCGNLGVVGVSVSILRPDVKMKDRIYITEELMKELKKNSLESLEDKKTEKKKGKVKNGKTK
jgi:small subunit ribosomal protein S3